MIVAVMVFYPSVGTVGFIDQTGYLKLVYIRGVHIREFRFQHADQNKGGNDFESKDNCRSQPERWRR